jgi:hypothetical protein
MILILGFHGLLEGGEGILDDRGQDSACARQLGAEAGAGQAGRAGGLADRAPLAFQRLVGGQLGGRRVPHVTAGPPLFLAYRPLDLVSDLVGHGARARLHQPALEIGDGIAVPAWLAATA